MTWMLDCKSEMGDGNGTYVRLGSVNDPEWQEFGKLEAQTPVEQSCRICWWLKISFICIFLLLIGGPCIIWGAPFLIDKVVIPILNWEAATFSKPALGFLLFVCIAIFPALLLPSSPCMWLAGMTFGYGFGFLLIMAGESIGMSLPYFIGSVFQDRIQRCLQGWSKMAAVVRLAGEGNWFHQFRAVVLLRISPFPYLVFNYAAVATNVKYSPYICGSLVGVVGEVFITIYSGILIRSLADASHHGQFLSLQQILYNSIGFCGAIAATIAITIYSKRALKTLQSEEDVLA